MLLGLIQSFIASLVLIGIYRFIASNSEYKVDTFMAFVFVFAPWFILCYGCRSESWSGRAWLLALYPYSVLDASLWTFLRNQAGVQIRGSSTGCRHLSGDRGGIGAGSP